MKISDVLQCSLPSWYANFKDVTIPSVCIPLAPEFLAYLREDGLFLPKEAVVTPAPRASNNDDDGWSSDSWSSDSEEDPDSKPPPSFPELSEKVKDAISRLGGSVFPKLNWSCPKDSAWIAMNRSLKCHSFGDVVLLLKASDFIQHDLARPFDSCEDQGNLTDDQKSQYFLVLRRWVDVNPAAEYRCFVKGGELFGISQRDVTTHYEHIEADREKISSKIEKFFEEKIREHFPCSNYTFDVFITEKVNLLDFNPFGKKTDSLLFEWSEISSEEPTASAEADPIFRYVEAGHGMRTSEYSRYQMPVDMVDLMSGNDPDKLVDFLKMKIQTETGDVDSSDGE